MLEAEGVSENECLRILRHETGHAIDEAYQLSKTPDYRRVFGPANKRYPTAYPVVPQSRDFVHHLNAWYAQAHPVILRRPLPFGCAPAACGVASTASGLLLRN